MTALLWCAVGLLLLICGAELIIRGGTHFAARLGVSPLVIGLTIVAIGTSTPELAVGIDAALQDEGELAVGNIAGTNMVNILLILGLSAVLRPLAIRTRTVRFDLPVVVIASAMLMAMAWDGSLSRMDGALLTMAGLGYTFAIVRIASHESRSGAGFAQDFTDGSESSPANGTGWSFAALILGIALSVLGAEWLVDGAVALAREWHVSDAFIGLTIVAIGTSSPELVTTVISTVRNTRDIAIGNLLGSSVYNILFILGITCLVPSGGIAIGRELILIDIPLMTAMALLCIPVFMSGREVSRAEGALFVSAYIAYLTYLIIVRT